MSMSIYELPKPIAQFRGEINDVDSHESLPINHWHDEYGSVVDDFINAINQSKLHVKTGKERDDAEINPDNVWKLKMEQAPGAWDIDRRLQVMDFTGVKRQLMFPGTMGTLSVGFYARAEQLHFFRTLTGDRKGYARKLHKAYNDWCVRAYKHSERLRPVAILIEETPEDLIATAKKLIGQGVRAFWLPTDRPLAGVSPAHPILNPLWDMLSEARAVLAAHVGAHEGLLKTMAWRDAPAFDGWKVGEEFSYDPWSLSTYHLGVQTFVTAMVLGGVFERYPNLILGSFEFGGHWMGPLAENLDRWYEHKPFPSETGAKLLELKPSEYIRRNIRVACFDFEAVGTYIDRHGLEEVYCYASDFPHHEGGKDPMGDFVKSLEGKSDQVLRKFFVENGKDMLPD